VTMRFVPVDVREVLSSLEGLISGQARAHRVQIFTSFHGGPAHVMADEALLKQAFLNIMLNALESMPGGGDLAISTRLANSTTPGVPERTDGSEWLEVVFDDTGMGIPAEHVSRVFDPFFTTKKDGTGLGLAITYRIIENHRGDIRVVSQPSKGTTVIITLPLEGNVPQ
jgi:signal transduction histidine kinase